MNYDWQLLKILFYLVFVIILIIVVAKIMRNTLNNHKQGKYVTVIEQLYLGQKNFISLVKVKDKIFLLGVGTDRIQKLAEWPEDEFADLSIEQQTDYSKKFSEILKKHWRGSDD